MGQWVGQVNDDMAGTANGGRTSWMGWIPFVWTVITGLVSGSIAGVSAYQGSLNRLRVEVKEELRAEMKREMSDYLPMSTYYALREELLKSTNNIERKLDRIEATLGK